MKKTNENGSVLIAVISVILLILVVLGITLSIAFTYQKRAINEHARKQAYLSGLSVAQGIAGQIGNDKNKEEYLPAKTSDTVQLTVESLPEVTGTIHVVIKYDEDDSEILYIQVTSTYSNQTEEIQLTMQLKNGQWYTKVYSEIGDDFSDQK